MSGGATYRGVYGRRRPLRKLWRRAADAAADRRRGRGAHGLQRGRSSAAGAPALQTARRPAGVRRQPMRKAVGMLCQFAVRPRGPRSTGVGNWSPRAQRRGRRSPRAEARSRPSDAGSVVPVANPAQRERERPERRGGAHETAEQLGAAARTRTHRAPLGDRDPSGDVALLVGKAVGELTFRSTPHDLVIPPNGGQKTASYNRRRPNEGATGCREVHASG